MAGFTLPYLLVIFPIMIFSGTLLANNAFLLSDLLNVAFAVLLVFEFLIKISKFHSLNIRKFYRFRYSCGQSLNIISETELHSIYIYQHNSETRVPSPTATLKLERDDFSVRFYNKLYNAEKEKFYATQIAALIDRDEFEKVKVGMTTEDISYLAPGSGMAPSTGGSYEFLIFQNFGHHYLFYENEESNRVNLLQKFDEHIKLEFEITALIVENEEVTMENTSLNEFYMVVFTDRNLNKVIDVNELYKLTIQLN